MNRTYKEDILGNGFYQTQIKLNPDYGGFVTATLIRRLSDNKTNKAILYIHGFNDYFFQEEMAKWFNEKGFNFYALDLRRYGRSHLSSQKLNDIRNLKLYYEEINSVLEIIKEEHNTHTLLMGYSTGGLIVTLYAKDNPTSLYYDGLILNSPFFDFNISKFSKKLLPLLCYIGKFIPKIKVSGGFDKKYGESLHKKYNGEWNYHLPWKPNIPPKVNLGWLNAIHSAHRELSNEFEIKKPILLLHSSRSNKENSDTKTIQSSDIILDIDDIIRVSKNMKGDIETVSIENGMHDLVLSTKPVRKMVYKIIENWIIKKEF